MIVTGKGGFIGGFLSKRLNTENLLVHCATAKTYDEDLLLAKSAFNKASEHGLAVVFLSSISVYGEVSETLVTEETVPVSQSPYAMAKWEIEKLLQSYDLNSLTLRLPGVVGPGAHDIFLSRALASIKRGDRVRAYNPEGLFNNLVHLSDIAKIIEKWYIKQAVKKNCRSTVNMGCKDPITIREVISLMGGEGDFSDVGKQSFLISIEKAISLGFEPSSVADTLRSYVLNLELI